MTTEFREAHESDLDYVLDYCGFSERERFSFIMTSYSLSHGDIETWMYVCHHTLIMDVNDDREFYGYKLPKIGLR